MLFEVDETRPSDSPLIDKIWYIRTAQGGDFTSQAASLSGLVITRFEGITTVTVRGPETKATLATAPPDGEFIGIDFKLGTFMPSLLPKNLADRRDAYLPTANDRAFWLDSAAWEIPDYENADTFIARLVREGLLAHDPVVSAILQGQPQAYSLRTLQHRFMRATGMAHKVVQQIDRAQQALTLLQRGTSISDTAFELGYFDQSHLTNALKRFIGQTPAEIARTSQPE